MFGSFFPSLGRSSRQSLPGLRSRRRYEIKKPTYQALAAPGGRWTMSGAANYNRAGQHDPKSAYIFVRQLCGNKKGGSTMRPSLAKRILLFFGVLLMAVPASAATCESLTNLKLPDTKITSAEVEAAGAFTPPAPGGNAAAASQFSTLPAFCRVTVTLTPSSDSDIKVEVWLPVSGWNGKFQAVGNGGWAGTISYPALALAVKGGYATASTDTGHTGGGAAFALGHPEKLTDHAYRAVHDMTVQSKAIINAFYANSPTLSFWNGCSLGGRQGITEAMLYPADFDAIVSGASALNAMLLHGSRVAINHYAHRSADSYIPPEKYPMIHAAVLQACDAMDGVKDGVIENPSRCHFNPAVLACKGADAADCLTPAQVETARAIYSPVKNPKSGEEIRPALLQPGSELNWATLNGPEPLSYTQELYKYVILKDPNWNWHRFNPAGDIDRALQTEDGQLNFTDANLSPFFKHGGKLLMYHGWSDQQVTPLGSVDYFNEVVAKTDAGVVGKSIELYMVPGMYHCQGGPGTDGFDKMAAMESWIATGA